MTSGSHNGFTTVKITGAHFPVSRKKIDQESLLIKFGSAIANEILSISNDEIILMTPQLDPTDPGDTPLSITIEFRSKFATANEEFTFKTNTPRIDSLGPITSSPFIPSDITIEGINFGEVPQDISV